MAKKFTTLFGNTKKRYNSERTPEPTTPSSPVEVITILSSDEGDDFHYSQYGAKRQKTGTPQWWSSENESDLDIDKSIDYDGVDMLR